MKTITDYFEQYEGTTEYNGIVALIQRWYYGTLIKAAWCATSISYFSEIRGILGQIGGKNENVYEMMQACQRASQDTGRGAFFNRADLPAGAAIKRGAIVFMMFDEGRMTSGSRKHVTTAKVTTLYTGEGSFRAIGGNQNDGIFPKTYDQRNIYAVFYPVYGRDPREFVEILYRGALGRNGEKKGVTWWRKGLACEALTGIRAAKEFYLGDEYKGRGRSDREYVRDLYAGLLGRSPDPEGYNYWLDQLATGRLRREDILKGFAISAEYMNRCNVYDIARGSWPQE